MVFGKRDARGDAPQEEPIGSLYGETPVEPVASSTPSTSSAATSSAATDYRREPTEGILDAHARFNGKFVSDRDLRIDGEAQGEIECQGTLVLSPQARVRASIKAHNVVINGDYEGNVDSGGRFEIGSTGRVKGEVKTQVLVIKEGAFFDGAVVMTRKTPPAGSAESGTGATKSTSGGGSATTSADAAKRADAEAELYAAEILSEPAAAIAGTRTATGPGDLSK